MYHFTFEMGGYAPVNVPIFYSNGFDSIYKKSSSIGDEQREWAKINSQENFNKIVYNKCEHTLKRSWAWTGQAGTNTTALTNRNVGGGSGSNNKGHNNNNKA